MYTSAVSSVQSSLLGLILSLAQLRQSVLFYRHYLELLALPLSRALPGATKAVPQLRVGITFRNVSFRYSEQHPWTLRHVDLFLPANTCMALVGLNGAGKTTLVKLLTRLYDPTEGEILWDGIDLRAFDPQAAPAPGGHLPGFHALRFDGAVEYRAGRGQPDRALRRGSAIGNESGYS